MGRENDFNRFYGDEEEFHFHFEEELEKTETWAGDVLSKIDNGQPLTAKDWVRWSVFVAALFMRTRKVREQVVAPKAQALFNEMAPLVLSGLSEKRIAHFMQGSSNLLARPAFLHFVEYYGKAREFAAALREKRWFFISPEGQERFITSDAPVFMAKARENELRVGYGIKDPDAAIFLPISPMLLFVGAPEGYPPVLLNDSNMKIFNRAIVHCAHREVYAPDIHPEVQQSVDDAINQIRFFPGLYKG